MDKKTIVAIVVVGAVTLLLAYGNTLVKERGPSEDVFFDTADPFLSYRSVLENLKKMGMDPKEAVPFTIPVKPGWTGRLKDFVAQGETQLGGQWVSLVGMPDLRVYPDPASSPNNPLDIVETRWCLEGFSETQGWQQLKRDPLCGNLIFAMGKKNPIVKTMVIWLPQGQKDELERAQDVVRFIQQGKDFEWWKVWNLDIHPAPEWEDIRIPSWIVARILIHYLFLLATATLFVVGSLTIIPWQFYSYFHSLKAAAWAVVHIWLGLVCQRGLMGFLGVPESVFSIIGYSVLLIFGPSALLRTFDEGKRARTTILLAALFGATGFANSVHFTLGSWEFGSQLPHIAALGWTGLLGIGVMALLGNWSFPMFVQKPTHDATESLLDRLAASIANRLKRPAYSLLKGGYRNLAIASILVGSTLAYTLLQTGQIPTDTNVKEFIRGTSVAQELELLNQEGGPGHAPTDWIINCKVDFSTCMGGDVHEWVKIAMAHPKMGAQFGILTGYWEASEDLWGSVHLSESQFPEIWKPLTERVQHLQSDLWYPPAPLQPKGVRVTFSLRTQTNEELKEVIDEIWDAAGQFQDFETFPFNNSVIYSYVGEVLKKEMSESLLWTNLTYILLMFGYLSWRWWRIKNLSALWGAPVSCVHLVSSLACYLLLLWVSGIFTGSALDIASISIVSLLFDAGADFSLFFIRTFTEYIERGYSRERAFLATFRKEAPRILKDGMLNVGGFLVFIPVIIFLPPVGQLGFAMCFMTSVSCINTLLLLAPLLTLAVRPSAVPAVKQARQAILQPQPALKTA